MSYIPHKPRFTRETSTSQFRGYHLLLSVYLSFGRCWGIHGHQFPYEPKPSGKCTTISPIRHHVSTALLIELPTQPLTNWQLLLYYVRNLPLSGIEHAGKEGNHGMDQETKPSTCSWRNCRFEKKSRPLHRFVQLRVRNRACSKHACLSAFFFRANRNR